MKLLVDKVTNTVLCIWKMSDQKPREVQATNENIYGSRNRFKMGLLLRHQGPTVMSIYTYRVHSLLVALVNRLEGCAFRLSLLFGKVKRTVIQELLFLLWLDY